MTADDDQQPPPNPSEQRGGSTAGEQEAEEKGAWVAEAKEGVVPAELGGSDAPEEMLGDDPELKSDALGQPAASDQPATQSGIDRTAGDHADATEHGGAERAGDAEPDLKDAASGPRQTDLDSSG
jgi:hypothetical protein